MYITILHPKDITSVRILSNVRQLVSYNMHNIKILLMNVMNSLLRSHPSTAHVFHFYFKAIKKFNWQHAVYSF